MSGAAGVTLLLIAFLMYLLKIWSQENLFYILMNVLGAGVACASSILIRFVPFIILEGVRRVVSAAALFSYFRKRRLK